jgi:hypothetical protein
LEVAAPSAARGTSPAADGAEPHARVDTDNAKPINTTIIARISCLPGRTNAFYAKPAAAEFQAAAAP